MVGGEVRILDREETLLGATREDLREATQAGRHALAEADPDGVGDLLAQLRGRAGA